MASLTIAETKQAFDIHPDNVVRMYKTFEDPPEAHDSLDGFDPTTIKTVHGDFVVLESTRTILARFGESREAFSPYMEPTAAREAYYSLSYVVALTKFFEVREGKDPTVVHLSTGDRVHTTDSIRTLTARLDRAGHDTIDVDMVDTERPAAVVRDAVKSIESLSDDDLVELELAGGMTIECRDDDLARKCGLTMTFPTGL